MGPHRICMCFVFRNMLTLSLSLSIGINEATPLAPRTRLLPIRTVFFPLSSRLFWRFLVICAATWHMEVVGVDRLLAWEIFQGTWILVDTVLICVFIRCLFLIGLNGKRVRWKRISYLWIIVRDDSRNKYTRWSKSILNISLGKNFLTLWNFTRTTISLFLKQVCLKIDFSEYLIQYRV